MNIKFSMDDFLKWFYGNKSVRLSYYEDEFNDIVVELIFEDVANPFLTSFYDYAWSYYADESSSGIGIGYLFVDKYEFLNGFYDDEPLFFRRKNENINFINYTYEVFDSGNKKEILDFINKNRDRFILRGDLFDECLDYFLIKLDKEFKRLDFDFEDIIEVE